MLFEPVGEDDRRLLAALPVAYVDELADGLLVHDPVYDGKGDHLGDDLAQEDPSRGRVDQLAVHPHLDPRVEVDLARIIGDPHLFGVGEISFPLPAGTSGLW